MHYIGMKPLWDSYLYMLITLMRLSMTLLLQIYRIFWYFTVIILLTDNVTTTLFEFFLIIVYSGERGFFHLSRRINVISHYNNVNERDGVANHRRPHGLLNCLFKRRTKNRSKLHVTGLCAGKSSVTGEFPAQSTSNVENVSIWWHHHGCYCQKIEVCSGYD